MVQKFFRGVSGGASRGVSGKISVRDLLDVRPAHTPDIALAGKNPMSVALTERYHKSQDNYLLGKKAVVTAEDSVAGPRRKSASRAHLSGSMGTSVGILAPSRAPVSLGPHGTALFSVRGILSDVFTV